MNADYLHAFCVVAREGNVTLAARQLGLSQPAVSRQLRLLQDACGRPLYRRSGQGIALTPAGRELLPYACGVSEALQRARERISGDLPTSVTRLQVALSHHLITRYTGPLLRAARNYNDEGYLLKLHLQEGYTPELISGLRSGRLDAAFVLGSPQGTDDLDHDSSGSERISLVVRDDDPLAQHSPLELSALDGETLVLPSSASIVFQQMQKVLARSGVQPGRELEVSGPGGVRSAVHAGLGIGVSVSSFIEPAHADASLRLVEVDEPELVLPVTRLQRKHLFLLPDQQHALAYLAAHLPET